MYDETYEEFSSFLSLLAARCTSYFPLKRARPAVPPDLLALLSRSRALSFKARRKGDMILRQEAHRMRNLVRSELKRFRQGQLTKQLNERHTPGESSKRF